VGGTTSDADDTGGLHGHAGQAHATRAPSSATTIAADGETQLDTQRPACRRQCFT